MSGNRDDEGKSTKTEASSKEHGETFDFSALQELLNDPAMSIMLESFTNLTSAEWLKEQMARIKEDPSLKLILQEIKSEGPSAMLKYWNDPNVLRKLGQAMGSSDALVSEEENEDEAQYEHEPVLHHAASVGNAKALRKMLAARVDKNEKDRSGRSALHFACLYNEGSAVDCRHGNRYYRRKITNIGYPLCSR